MATSAFENSFDREKPAWRIWLNRGFLLLVLLPLLIATTVGGLRIRRWTWDITVPPRFAGDMNRNFIYGSRATNEGFFNVYENVYAQRQPGDYDIDYPPLRLLTFDVWIQILKRRGQDVTSWDPSYQFNQPLLDFNTFTEAASAIAVFLIIRRWTRPTPPLPIDRRQSPNWESWLRAAAGALLVWFSPGGLADGHGWASYDVWIPPFFLWGILLVSFEWWTLAGILLGIGAMFKGQMLLVIPLFILWPLLAAQPMRALRFAVGFIIATAFVVSPFILSSEIGETGDRLLNWPAIAWIGSVVVAALMVLAARSFLPVHISLRARRILIAFAFACAVLIALWPIFKSENHSLWPIALGAVAVYLAAAWFARGRWFGLVPITGAAIAIFASMAIFHTSPAWWSVGFQYGSQRFFHLVQGPNANLPALLNRRFQWEELTDTALTLRSHLIWRWPAEPRDVTTRQFLIGLYFIALGICSIAASIHWRRRDSRFLVAVSTVWLMFYCLLPQMIGRYLLFGSTIGAIAVAESFGLGLLVFLLSCITAVTTLECMGGNLWGLMDETTDVQSWKQFNRLLQHTTPDLAWAVLLAAAIFLFFSLQGTIRNAFRSAKIARTTDS